MTRIAVTKLAVIVSTFLSCAVIAAGQTPGPRSDNQQLQGGWVLSIVPDPGAPALPPVQPTTHLMMFTTDGGVVSQWNQVPPPGNIATSGIGAWRRTGNNEFEITQYFEAATVDASGGHSFGYFKQRLLLHYGPTSDDLSGPADFALMDLDGNVLFGGPFAVELHRIKVERVGSSF